MESAAATRPACTGAARGARRVAVDHGIVREGARTASLIFRYPHTFSCSSRFRLAREGWCTSSSARTAARGQRRVLRAEPAPSAVGCASRAHARAARSVCCCAGADRGAQCGASRFSPKCAGARAARSTQGCRPQRRGQRSCRWAERLARLGGAIAPSRSRCTGGDPAESPGSRACTPEHLSVSILALLP